MTDIKPFFSSKKLDFYTGEPMTDMIGNISRDELVLMTKTHAQSAIEIAYGEGLLEGIKRAKAQLLTQQEPVAKPFAVAWSTKAGTQRNISYMNNTSQELIEEGIAIGHIPTYLYTSPPDTQQKLDKAREALQSVLDSGLLNGSYTLHDEIKAEVQQALKDTE